MREKRIGQAAAAGLCSARMNKPEPAGAGAADIVFDRDFIVIYRALGPSLCEAITRQFDADGSKRPGRIGAAGDTAYAADTKVSWDLEILPNGPWADLFRRIHPVIQSCIAHYLSRSPILQSFPLEATGYKIQMYPRGEGHFRWHADAAGGASADRVVAMVLYLNDVAQGGETEFFHQGLKISPRAGQLVLFPAGWNYMHCGHTPVSGDKYIISTFIRIKR